MGLRAAQGERRRRVEPRLARGALDPVELADLLDGDRGPQIPALERLDEASAHVRHAAHLDRRGPGAFEELVEAGVAVGLQPADPSLDERTGRLALPGRRVAEARPAPIPHQTPQMSAPHASGMAAVEHAQTRIVDLQSVSAERPLVDRVGDRLEQLGALPHPVAQGRGRQLHAGAPEDGHLAVQRQVIAKLRHQHVRQQSRTGPAAVDHPIRQRRDRHALATARAGVLLAHMHEHAETRRHPVEHFGTLGADAGPLLAAVRAGELLLGRTMHNLLARQIRRQRLAARRLRARPLPGALRGALAGSLSDHLLLRAVGLGAVGNFLEQQRQLVRIDLLRTAAVRLAQHLGEPELEAVGVLVHASEEPAGDLDRLVGLSLGEQRVQDIAQRIGRGQLGGGAGHAMSVAHIAVMSSIIVNLLRLGARRRWHRALLPAAGAPDAPQVDAVEQAGEIPASISTARAPSRTAGQRKRPRSRRLANRHHPDRSR